VAPNFDPCPEDPGSSRARERKGALSGGLGTEIRRPRGAHVAEAGIYPGRVLDLSSLDLDEIATTLAGHPDSDLP